MFCQNCNTELKTYQIDNKNKYCSRSCAIKVNNSKFPKRSKEGKCYICTAPIISKNKYCTECLAEGIKQTNIEKFGDLSLKTKGEIFSQSKSYQAPRSRIRLHARKSISKPKCCGNCGYDKHVEIAHRRSVASFPDSAILAEINAPSNLIGLCPNCHWELDNGYLVL